MLTNCTNSQNSAADSQSGTDSAQVDTTSAGQNQDTMKADTPITNGQRSTPKESH
jgi:hypothetical protein